MKIQLDVWLFNLGDESSVYGIVQNIHHKTAQLRIAKGQMLWCVRADNLSGNSLFYSGI